MKKIILTLILGIFLISFISALDPQLPQICGGDDELLIGCIGDDELTFLSGLPGLEDYGSGSGAGAEYTTIEEEIEPEIEEVEKLIDWVLIILCVILCFMICLLIFRKKKCNYCKKRFRKKDLIKYKEKYYCKNCYEKVNRNI